MSTVVSFNGASYIIPATGEVGWGNNVSSYLIAIAASSFQKSGGLFTLSAEADFGSAFGLKSLYYKSRSSNVASTGVLRLANNSDAISWRDFANSTDLPLLVNASNQLTFNGTPIGGSGIFTANRAIISDGSGNLSISAVTSTELGYLSGVTSSIQTQLGGKEPTITVLPISKGGTNSASALNNDRIMQSLGGAIVEAAAITAARALISDTNGIPVASTITSTELGFVSGVTSSIQTQLNGKQATLSLPLSVPNGGTGDSSLTAYAVLCGGTTSTTPIQSVAGLGTTGFVLTSNGAGTLPTFQAVTGSGTVNAGVAGNFAYYVTSSNAVSPIASINVTGTGQMSLTAANNSSFSDISLINFSGGSFDLRANSISVTGTLNGRDLGNSGSITSPLSLIISANATSGVGTSDMLSLGSKNVEGIAITSTSVTTQLPTAVKGIPTNDVVAAGYIGEVIESIISVAANTPASATYGDATSISLTAGKWSLSWVVELNKATGVFTSTDFQIGIATAAGNVTTGLVQGDNTIEEAGVVPTTFTRTAMSLSNKTVLLSGNKTYYLKLYLDVYTSGQPTFVGRLTAIRIA